MYKIFIQLYKSVPLNIRSRVNYLVIKMKAREALSGSFAAVLLACLLAVSIYWLPLESDVLRPSFGFVWGSGADSQAESEYNVCLRRAFFKMNFYFVNGTVLSIPNLWPEIEMELDPDAQIAGSTGPALPEYQGEIDASSLVAIGVRFIQFGVKRPGDAIATMEIFENRSVEVHLVSGGVITGMGTHDYLNEQIDVWFNQTHMMTGSDGRYEITPPNTGYFVERFIINVPAWKITLNDLYQMLPDTGTATIEFHTTIDVDILHYNITVIGGDTKIGAEKLMWDGILGTYELIIDQGRVLSVKYDFISAFLFLKIQK